MIIYKGMNSFSTLLWHNQCPLLNWCGRFVSDYVFGAWLYSDICTMDVLVQSQIKKTKFTNSEVE